MIIITGHEGFIGKKFLEKLEGKEYSKLKRIIVGISDKVLMNGRKLN